MRIKKSLPSKPKVISTFTVLKPPAGGKGTTIPPDQWEDHPEWENWEEYQAWSDYQVWDEWFEYADWGDGYPDWQDGG